MKSKKYYNVITKSFKRNKCLRRKYKKTIRRKIKKTRRKKIKKTRKRKIKKTNKKLYIGGGLEGINNISGLVYINLDNRPDRHQYIKEEIKKFSMPEEKIHKVSGIYTPKNGHKGCVQSHILALNIAKLNNWNNLLILEDDAELIVSPEQLKEKLKEIFHYMENNNINWDVIMLATGYSKKKNIINNISKLETGTTGSAYIINKHYFEKLINLFEECNRKMNKKQWSSPNDFEYNALDQKWKVLQEKDNWYCFEKDLIKQKNIWSTTMNSINDK